MRNSIVSVACAAFIASIGLGMEQARSTELPEEWEPGMLVLNAERATVSSGAEGKTLTLNGLHPLVLIAADLHESRHFDAVDVTGFSEAYNTCNMMKHANDLWHEDGSNSLLAYVSGPDNGGESSYRMHLPLVTSEHRDDRTRVANGDMGSIKLFLDDASQDEDNETVQFTVAATTPLVDGEYEGIVLKTECFIWLLWA